MKKFKLFLLLIIFVFGMFPAYSEEQKKILMIMNLIFIQVRLISAMMERELAYLEFSIKMKV